MSPITSPFLTLTPLERVSRTACVTSIVCTRSASAFIARMFSSPERSVRNATTAETPCGMLWVPITCTVFLVRPMTCLAAGGHDRDHAHAVGPRRRRRAAAFRLEDAPVLRRHVADVELEQLAVAAR